MKTYQQSDLVLGSEAVLSIVSEISEIEVKKIFLKLWQEIDQFDLTCSRFRHDSELTKLNNSAGQKVRLSTQLNNILHEAFKYYRLTDGVFNPMILPSLQRVGYKNSLLDKNKNLKSPDYSKREIGNFTDVVFENDFCTIPVNTAIDLGGIGKGYLLDHLARILNSLDIDNFWLSLGGDILAEGHDQSNMEWKISIDDALNQNQPIAEVNVPKGQRLAIATSGVTKRRGISKGKSWNHIIDSRSGLSTDTDIATATICHESATAADVFATCLVSQGSINSNSIIKKNKLTDYLLQIKKDAKLSTIQNGTKIILKNS